MNDEEFPDCKHLDFEARDDDMVGWCTCRTCGMHLRIHEAFNNLQRAIFKEYQRAKDGGKE